MLFIVTVGKIIGVSQEIIERFSYGTKSLEHRLEDFLTVGETTFINDSKGTNIDSTKFAVEAFKNPILICGGKDKKFDLAPLAKIISDSVKEVLLIGENRFLIIKELEKINFPKERVQDLENIQNCAKYLKGKLNLREKNIVLFSPATSSFDQFKNFEDRGEKFKKVITEYFGGE
jgi:UDP-N-acetylmuramoylalanine--D-glutamate ligase